MASSTFNIKPLTKENYGSWSVQMEAVAVKNGTWKHVCGKIPRPKLEAGANEGASRVAQEKWDDENAKARADLIIAIDPSLLRLVKGLNIAAEVWCRLKSEFASEGPVKKASLLKRISTFKMSEGDDLRTQLMEFFDVTAQLESMDIPINPELLSYMLLNSLPPSFNMLKCSMESRDVVPSPEIIRQKVLEEFDSRNQQKDEAVEAMWVQRSKGKFQYGRGGKRNGGSRQVTEDKSRENKNFRFKCFKCHCVGHKAADCIEKGSQGNTKRESSSKAEVVGTVFQSVAPEEALGIKDNAGVRRWCLDSGCTSHMCNDENILRESMNTKKEKLLLASNIQIDVDSRGTASVMTTNDKKKESVKLNDVLLVKELRTNLLSVAKITDYGHTVLFKKDRATVRGKDGKIKLVAEREGNLYYFSEKPEQVNLVNNIAVSIDVWHRRLGHLNECDVLKLSKRGLATGINIKGEKLSQPCDVCLRGKLTALPFPKRSQRSSEVLNIVHSDVWGPARTESFRRSKYFVTFIDDHSRWGEVIFLRNKSDVFQAFKEYKARVENQTGKRIKCLMTDNGREYCNSEFDKFLKENGISRRLTVAHTPQQNGVAERMNRTLVNMARCLLMQTGLKCAFWAEALAASNYLRNRCPTASLEGHTPYEYWYKCIPDLSNLRAYGAKAYVLQKEPGRGKFEPKAKEGVLVGYSEESKGYRVYVPEDNKVVITRDVRFVEEGLMEKTTESEKDVNEFDKDEEGRIELQINSNEDSEQSATVPQIVVESPVRSSATTTATRGPGRPRLMRSGNRGRPRKVYQMRSAPTKSRARDTVLDDESKEGESEAEDEVLTDDSDDDIQKLEMANLVDQSVKRAMSSHESQEWLEAIAEEIKALIKHDTWTLVERPKDKKVITCRIVLRNKMKPDGSLERRKARVVARGFTQREGIDFAETFAPVARLDSVRLLMALAARENLQVFQLDVVAAYLNGELDEEIFMEIPEYIEEALNELVQQDGNSEVSVKAREMIHELHEGEKVCRLNKALYGLRQAGRQWNKKLDKVLKSLKLRSAVNDTCLYYNTNDRERTFVVVYVDDILYASNSEKRLQEIRAGLSKAFDIKDLGLASCCLGIEIKQEGGEIKLGQTGYVRDLLEKFSMSESKPVNTPSEPRVNLPIGVSRKSENQKDIPYKQLIGSLMYLAIATRPDIAFTVNRLAQFNVKYGEEHWAAAKRVLRYLRGTQNQGLVYRKNKLGIIGFSDADHAADTRDRISYTGYVFLLSGAPITWRSCKQKAVAISTTEAEYVALSEATREAVYLRNLMLDMKMPELLCATIGSDNHGAKAIAENAVYHSRTKHIATRYHFVRQALKENQFKLVYTPTEEMPADILTKPLPGPAHFKHMLGMGMSVC